MYVAYSIYIILKKNIVIKTTLKIYYNRGLKLICTIGFKHCCYPIQVAIIIDYKKQVFITRIKVNIQCFIYHNFLQK